MGSDNAAQIQQWKDWKKILEKIAIAIYPRATHPLSEIEKMLEKYSNKIDEGNHKDLMRLETPCLTFINGPMNDISSSGIRNYHSLAH
jgi:nicotinate-nucleotide adenylyltransferase